MDVIPIAGTVPALMTPCTPERKPDFAALVRKGRQLVDPGCRTSSLAARGGDWPLLDDAERMTGVERRVEAGVPVIVATGAQTTPHAHFDTVQAAGESVPSVIDNGPHYSPRAPTSS